MKVVYISHPLAGEFDINRLNAANWVGFLAERYMIAPVADWIILSGEWKGHGKREMRLRIDCTLVERCDEIWLVGGRISEGMRIESNHAKVFGKRIRDLTSVGYYVCPEDTKFLDKLDYLVELT